MPLQRLLIAVENDLRRIADANMAQFGLFKVAQHKSFSTAISRRCRGMSPASVARLSTRAWNREPGWWFDIGHQPGSLFHALVDNRATDAGDMPLQRLLIALAQRVPVRIAFDTLPADVTLVSGTTCTVSIGGQPLRSAYRHCGRVALTQGSVRHDRVCRFITVRRSRLWSPVPPAPSRSADSDESADPVMAHAALG
jgi:hypothetical protein